MATTTDDVQQLTIKKLNKHHLLRLGVHRHQFKFFWVEVRMGHPYAFPYVQVWYRFGGGVRYYHIELEAIPSHLPTAQGQRYYLLCPLSSRRASVLYLRPDTGMLVHRLAWGPGRLYYPAQIITESARYFARQSAEDDAWAKAYHKRNGRKLWYKGKPTRWHGAILRMQQRLGYPPPIVERKHRKHLLVFLKS